MNQNRRAFLGTLGLFSILPGAGRVWRATRAPAKLKAYWYTTDPILYQEASVNARLSAGLGWMQGVVGPDWEIRFCPNRHVVLTLPGNRL